MQSSNDAQVRILPAQKEPWMVRPLHISEYHRFEYGESGILFDVATGTFFKIDRVIHDLLDLCEGRSLLDLLNLLRGRHPEKEIVSAFRELYEAGILSEVPLENRPFTPPGRLEVVHLGLDITYDGLSASHMFTRNGDACPSSAYMGEAVACKAIDLMMSESGRVRQCHVTFQGGEPLLNPQLVERVIEYGQEVARQHGKDIVFEVTSDSRLLNQQIFERLKKHRANIVVKSDENTSEDLSMFHGSGPFSLSSKEVRQHARDPKASVHLNRTVDRNSLDLREQVRRELSRHPAVKSITLKFRPLPSDDPAALTEADLPRALAGLADLADYVKDHILSGKPAWIGDFEDCISQVFNHKFSFYHCGAGTRYLTVAPDGKLYVCPGLVGREAFSVGDLQDGIDRDRRKTWIKSTHVEKFEACATCWTRYLCGGGCRLGSFLGSGEIERPNPVSCALIRRTYELAMGACLDIAGEDPEILERRYGEETAP